MMRGCQRRKIVNKIKTRGYDLNSGALDKIILFADHFPHDSLGEAIDLLLDNLQQESLKSSILHAESVQGVISRLLGALGAADEPTTAASSLVFIDAFVVPKYRYDAVKKKFIIEDTSSPLPVHAEASAKTELYRERFMLLWQKVSCSEYFSRPAFGSSEISPIQSLLFQMGRKWVMGLISQLEDGHIYLEDLSASVEIDLSKAKITTGFFTENTIILAEGEMHNGIFQVITCGFPPLEDRNRTLRTHSGYDFFGAGTPPKEDMIRLADLERQAVNDTFVILSDIWLDDEEEAGNGS